MPPKKRGKRSRDDSEDDEEERSTSKSKKSKKQQLVEEPEEEEEDLWGEEEDDASKQKSLQKSFIDDVVADDDDDSANDDAQFDDGYGSDLYGDDEDRARLEAMPDLEREGILYDRAEKRKKLEERRQAQIQAREQKRARAEQTSRSSKQSMKKGKTKKQKDEDEMGISKKARSHTEALADLLQRRRTKPQMKQSAALSMQEEGEVGDEEEEPTKIQPDDDDEQIDDTVVDDDITIEQDESMQLKSETPLRLMDIRNIQIRRTALEKLIDEPYFDKFITNMFCRVSVGTHPEKGQQYRMAVIAGVEDYPQKYRFANRDCHRCLRLQIGKSERLFTFSMISNKSITEEEMQIWLAKMRESEQPILTAEEAISRKKSADALRGTFQYSSEVIEKMLEDKKKTMKNVNHSKERSQLKLQYEIAKQKGETEKIEEIEAKLQLLDERAAQLRRKVTAKRGVFEVMDINAKNRDRNAQEIERLIAYEREESKRNALAKQQPKLDPFSRRATRPELNWDVGDEADVAEKKAKEAAEKAAKEKAAEEKKEAATRPAISRDRLQQEIDDLIESESHPINKTNIPTHRRQLHLPRLITHAERILKEMCQQHQGIQECDLDQPEPKPKIRPTLHRYPVPRGERTLTLHEYYERREQQTQHEQMI